MTDYNIEEKIDKLLEKVRNSEKCFRADNNEVYQVLNRNEVTLLLDYINYLKKRYESTIEVSYEKRRN